MGAVALVCIGTGALLMLASLAGCAFAIHAGFVLQRYRARPLEAWGEEPSVTLLKPLHGAEPGLREALESFLRQDYGGGVHMRLGLQSPDDPALAVARALAVADTRARVVLDATAHGENRKVSNLVNLSAEALADLVVQSDSDIAVAPDYLRRLAAVLAEPEIGAATCLYLGAAAEPTLAARLGAMGVSYASLPLFAVGVSLGATPCMGSTIALRRETLKAIGGFAAVKDVLADDYALGVKVRALGLKTVVPDFLVTHRSSERTLGELWSHEVRWARTVFDIDPGGHLGSVVTHPLPLAVLGCLLTAAAAPSDVWLGLSAVLVALCARLWLKSRVDAVAAANRAAATSGPWWLLPLRDMMGFAVFFAAVFTRRVEWRGARFHVGRGGELTPV